MKHAIALWDRFWFEPRTTQALGLYRIALAVATACWLLHYLPDAAVFFSDQGLLRPETIREHDRFNLSAFLFTSSHPALVWGTLGVGLGLALALGLGLRPRLCAFLLFLVLLSLQARNRFLLNGGDVLLRTGLFWLALSPAGGGASYSLRPQSGLRATCWVQRMIQIQLVVIYVSTALWKWHSPEWQSGTAMYYVSSLVNHQVQGAELLLNFPQLCVFLTYLVPFLVSTISSALSEVHHAKTLDLS